MSPELVTELYFILSNGGSYSLESFIATAADLETRGMREKDDVLTHASRMLRCAARVLRILDSNLPRVDDHE
ncbi:MAG: hypothetical protein KatS3mg015_2743 [Fimbriimonadales bacterium]|nr:MAG: hypothetical protein KatS3mg015_2743 [Fimbriimonadales bacterium]